jgi:hypothetical protein
MACLVFATLRAFRGDWWAVFFMLCAIVWARWALEHWDKLTAARKRR